MKQTTITPVFVGLIPEELDDGVIYISNLHKIIVHRCCCGCGQEVVTPLSPADWRLKKEGSLITLRPSIGNWNYPCQSHYLITRNKVEWAGKMTKLQIQRVQNRDRTDKKHYISQVNMSKTATTKHNVHKIRHASWLSNLWTLLKQWWIR